jgi:hypothetical protein
MSNGAAFYAVDNSRKYLYFVRKSVESLRKFDKKTEIYLFVFGKPTKKNVDFVKKTRVHLKIMEPVSKKKGTFLKWIALAEMTEHERVIFIDADTCFFSGVQKLFLKYKKCDFYARQEGATAAEKTFWVIFGEVVVNQIDHELLKKITKKIGVRKLPIFNTGVMIFNHFFSLKIRSKLYKIEEFRKMFEKKKLRYPCTNFQLRDEICASLFLGGIKSLTWQFIDKSDSPWYIEWREGRVKSPGILLHTYSYYYPAFTLDFFGKKVFLNLIDRAY